MKFSTSLFSQILQIMPRSSFMRLVYDSKAERHAKGFSSWDQYVASFSASWPRQRVCNEAGLYILYQMHEGATGNVTAISLNDKGEWGPYSYSLKLDDKKSVELFKQGTPPKQGFFTRIFGL